MTPDRLNAVVVEAQGNAADWANDISHRDNTQGFLRTTPAEGNSSRKTTDATNTGLPRRFGSRSSSSEALRNPRSGEERGTDEEKPRARRKNVNL